MSNLFVDKISGKSGTSSGAPITLSGDTAILGSGVDINTSLASATIPAAGITGTLGSGVAFPAGHIIKIYGPSFYNTSGGQVKTTQAYGEIHSDFLVTVNNMLSSSNHLMFHLQAEFGCRSAGNNWANFSVGESADYTAIYAGMVAFTGNTAGSWVEMGNGTAGADRYNTNTFDMWSTGHSGSKTFSPLYKSEQGNSIRGCGGNTTVQFFQVYEIQA